MKLFVAPVALTLATIGGVHAWWKPTPGTSYQIQLTGTLDLSYQVDMYDLDMYDTPNATIAELQARGIKVVCYFSAGTYEDWRSDKDLYTADMIGSSLPEWEGESWVDIRNSGLRDIVKSRMELAKAKGCDGVDPDNVDGAFNDNGLNLTATDQLDFNTFLTTTAHDLDLAVGLKNDLNQIDDLVSVFDFSVNEQCAVYDECDMLVPFIEHDKPVFGIEYSGDKAAVCAASNARNFDTLFKSLSLESERYSCRDSDSQSGSGSVVFSQSESGSSSAAESSSESGTSSASEIESTSTSQTESESGSDIESESGSDVESEAETASMIPTSGACKRSRI